MIFNFKMIENDRLFIESEPLKQTLQMSALLGPTWVYHYKNMEKCIYIDYIAVDSSLYTCTYYSVALYTHLCLSNFSQFVLVLLQYFL